MVRATAAMVEKQNDPFTLVELELAAPKNDEVLVEIAGVGICHTDLVGQRGDFPIELPAIFGHEGAGTVVSTGADVTKVKRGDRVAMTFMTCGKCPCCTTGDLAYCYHMTRLNYRGKRWDDGSPVRRVDGPVSGNFFNQSSFATHAIANERNVVPVPDSVPLDIAGILGCGVQTGAGAVLRSLDCRPGASLLVLGGGAVGLSAVMAARIRGLKEIVVVELQESRRALALTLGATHAVNPQDGPLAEQIKAILAYGADTVLDTTGLPQVIEAVPKMLAKRGQFGFVGTPPSSALDLGLPGGLMAAMRNGWTFRGIIEGDSNVDEFLAELMGYYVEGRFPFDQLVTRYPMSEINRAIADQKAGLCVKPVLIPGDR